MRSRPFVAWPLFLLLKFYHFDFVFCHKTKGRNNKQGLLAIL